MEILTQEQYKSYREKVYGKNHPLHGIESISLLASKEALEETRIFHPSVISTPFLELNSRKA